MGVVFGGSSIALSVKFHQNTLSSFRDVGSQFALTHCFGRWLIQQLVLRTGRDNNNC